MRGAWEDEGVKLTRRPPTDQPIAPALKGLHLLTKGKVLRADQLVDKSPAGA